MRTLLKSSHLKFIKFLLSGGSAASVEYGSFLVLIILLNVPILGANIVSFLCGLGVSFLLNRVWVFKSAGQKKSEFARYFLLAVINLLLSTVIMGALVYNVGMSENFAKLIVMVLIASWNFVIFSKLIFKSKKEA